MTFVHDLSVEVRTLTDGDWNEVIGFHDSRDLRAGDARTRELVTALSHARTFVAHCSPRYFRSVSCGKEWTVFAGRVDAYEIGNRQHPSSIIPVFVRVLAVRIRKVAEEFPLPRARDQANFHTVPSAFTPRRSRTDAARLRSRAAGVPQPRHRERPHDLPPPTPADPRARPVRPARP